MNVYIVFGTTGEYSDRSEWAVKAFADEQSAKDMVERLSIWCDENHVGENNKVVADYITRHNLRNPEDPDFSCDYTGTRYSYYIVPLDFDILTILRNEFMETAKSKGWYSNPEYKIGDDLASMHSEVSELWEAHRKGELDSPCDKTEKMLSSVGETLTCAEEECADLIIKALCIASALKIDIARAVRVKNEFNKTRPFRHGKKN